MSGTCLGLLGLLYIFQPNGAWAGTIPARLVKSPKVMLGDTGLGSYLIASSRAKLDHDASNAVGPLLENFVLAELRKQMG